MKTYLCLFIILSLISCQTKKDKCSDSEIFLSEFSKGISEDGPHSNWHIFFFLKLEGNNIVKLNNMKLYEIYNGKYKSNYSFNEFLCAIFNERLILKETDLGQLYYHDFIFKLDKNIEKLSIVLLKNKFCRGDNNVLRLNFNIEINTRFTILYIFFKNKYYSSFADDGGDYHIYDRLKRNQ